MSKNYNLSSPREIAPRDVSTTSYPTSPLSHANHSSFNTSPINSASPDGLKKRTRTTAAQLAILESIFQRQNSPNTHVRSALALQLGMSERSVQIWFQNRRAKLKQSRRKSVQYQIENYRNVGLLLNPTLKPSPLLSKLGQDSLSVQSTVGRNSDSTQWMSLPQSIPNTGTVVPNINVTQVPQSLPKLMPGNINLPMPLRGGSTMMQHNHQNYVQQDARDDRADYSMLKGVTSPFRDISFVAMPAIQGNSNKRPNSAMDASLVPGFSADLEGMMASNKKQHLEPEIASEEPIDPIVGDSYEYLHLSPATEEGLFKPSFFF